MRLRVVAAHAGARDVLRAEGLEQQIGEPGRQVSADDVIESFLHDTNTKDVTSSGTAPRTLPGPGALA